METKSFLFAMLVVIGFSACGNPEPKRETKQSMHQHKEDEEHQHIYQCYMDCEKGKMYNLPGKCPVCQKDLLEKTTEHKSGDGHIH